MILLPTGRLSKTRLLPFPVPLITVTGHPRAAWWLLSVAEDLATVWLYCSTVQRWTGRVWKIVGPNHTWKYQLLEERVFAAIEYIREYQSLEDQMPVGLRDVPAKIKISAAEAVAAGWRPSWWKDHAVEEAYRAARRP